ncbi:MAG: sodium:proton antiporter, partial [Bacteroidetes bacterium]|nr:sodium:proton antiporter [Bacteroidota bacterium]
MNLFAIITILVVITASFAYLNARFLKLPETIGMMIISLFFSLLLIIAGFFFPAVTDAARMFMNNID